MTDLIPVHVGLMGHVDHGKTALARILSTTVSTAGLDKHPQAQRRGMTIDLGFTMFILDNFLVTLVDAPGHADLIQSVVAGANIVDAAILVVAADEGPKVQTGEHLLILQAMGITRLLVAITKIDLVTVKRVEEVEDKMCSIVREISPEHVEFVRVSAQTGVGLDELKSRLRRVLVPRPRDTDATLLLPVDHAFPIKGHGTVVTGTVLAGRFRVGDVVQIMPHHIESRVRAIQTFGSTRTGAQAGDRVGVNLPELDHTLIRRGDYLCTTNSLTSAQNLIVNLRVNPLYSERLTPRMVVNATIGMPTVSAQILPITRVDEKWVLAPDRVQDRTLTVALLLSERVPVRIGWRVLLMRTDLPPTSMRVLGAGEVIETHEEQLLLYTKRVRRGRIVRIREDDVLVEGLAHDRAKAEQLSNTPVQTVDGHIGVLGVPFGTRGVITARFDSTVREGTEVIHQTLKTEVYKFGR